VHPLHLLASRSLSALERSPQTFRATSLLLSPVSRYRSLLERSRHQGQSLTLQLLVAATASRISTSSSRHGARRERRKRRRSLKKKPSGSKKRRPGKLLYYYESKRLRTLVDPSWQDFLILWRVPEEKWMNPH
jgi:hypothetical protein